MGTPRGKRTPKPLMKKDCPNAVVTCVLAGEVRASGVKLCAVRTSTLGCLDDGEPVGLQLPGHRRAHPRVVVDDEDARHAGRSGRGRAAFEGYPGPRHRPVGACFPAPRRGGKMPPHRRADDGRPGGRCGGRWRRPAVGAG
jgi:hypothetical protein